MLVKSILMGQTASSLPQRHLLLVRVAMFHADVLLHVCSLIEAYL